nr:hypothetical protein [uncultured Bacteroides sp.]
MKSFTKQQKRKREENAYDYFGKFRKSNIFAPAIEKRWRDSSAG